MIQGFDDVIAKVKSCGIKKIAVAAAQDSAVLEAVREAKAQGIADAVLVGSLGIFMVKKMAASIHYENTDGKNVLTVVFGMK